VNPRRRRGDGKGGSPYSVQLSVGEWAAKGQAEPGRTLTV